jgi:hypothetical protein
MASWAAILVVLGLSLLLLALGHPPSPGSGGGPSSSSPAEEAGAGKGGKVNDLLVVEALLQLPPPPLGVGGSCEDALLGWNLPPVREKWVSHRDLLLPLVEGLSSSDNPGPGPDPGTRDRLAVGQVVPLSDRVIPSWLSLFGNASHSRYDPLDPAARARRLGYAIVTGVSGAGISLALRVQFEVVLWGSPPLYIMPSFLEGSLTASRQLDEVYDFSMSLPVAGRTFNVLVECGETFAGLGNAPHPKGGTVSPDGRRLSPYRLVVRPTPELDANQEEPLQGKDGEEEGGCGATHLGAGPDACMSEFHGKAQEGEGAGGQELVAGEESRGRKRTSDPGGVEGSWPEQHAQDDGRRHAEDYPGNSGQGEKVADDESASPEEREGNRLSGGFLIHPGSQ